MSWEKLVELAADATHTYERKAIAVLMEQEAARMEQPDEALLRTPGESARALYLGCHGMLGTRFFPGDGGDLAGCVALVRAANLNVEDARGRISTRWDALLDMWPELDAIVDEGRAVQLRLGRKLIELRSGQCELEVER